jgi:hypothetical protein
MHRHPELKHQMSRVTGWRFPLEGAPVERRRRRWLPRFP